MASKSLSEIPENHLKPWIKSDKEKLHEDFLSYENTDDLLAIKYKRNPGAIKAQRVIYGKKMIADGVTPDVIMTKCKLSVEEINDPKNKNGDSPHGKSVIDKKKEAKENKKTKTNDSGKTNQVVLDTTIVDPYANTIPDSYTNTIEDMDESEITASLGINDNKPQQIISDNKPQKITNNEVLPPDVMLKILSELTEIKTYMKILAENSVKMK